MLCQIGGGALGDLNDLRCYKIGDKVPFAIAPSTRQPKLTYEL